METEQIVSVLDRECLPGSPRLAPAYHSPISTSDKGFATKHLPDLGHDVTEFQAFHWKLKNWKNLDKKLTSPEFDCGGYKWCVLPVTAAVPARVV